MKRRKQKPVGSPLLSIATRETEKINYLFKLANVPYRLTVEVVFEMYCAASWKCQDTGRLYNVDNPLTIVWIDDVRHYGIADNLRIVCESESAFYLSWDIEHPHSWAHKSA
jgi:hypothetical protein